MYEMRVGSMRWRAAGFTLIELMIVVVVVAILAAIAYPAYQNQVEKTRRADGKAALTETAQRLERCYTANGRYDDTANCQAADTLDGGSIASEEGYYSVTRTTLNAAAFTLQATPQSAQSGDDCGTLILDQTGQKGASGGSVTNCW